MEDMHGDGFVWKLKFKKKELVQFGATRTHLTVHSINFLSLMLGPSL